MMKRRDENEKKKGDKTLHFSNWLYKKDQEKNTCLNASAGSMEGQKV